ncbi:MAG TPA: hypothetical protein PLZ51_13390, partial [Aggregatilineales bacterium]|nr:hypothetical protein [Aggregatilineales bacterium]
RRDDQFPSITEKLGYHPLGLKIVGARLRDMTSADWVKSYDITRMKMGYSAKKTDDNLVACFQVSVDSLPEELPPLYHALGIFPEDVWIPESMVTILWQALNPQLSSADCTDISIELAKLALIDRQRDTKQIRMHDLLHDYNRHKIREYDADLQSQFVTALSDPYTLPHEYAWRFYAYHLMGANRLAELRPLLVSYRWLDAKLHATDPKALMDDCTIWLTQGKDETIRLIRSALDMSANTLLTDKNALAHQLAGRLMHYYNTMDEIAIFWDNIIPPKNSSYPLFIGNNE